MILCERTIDTCSYFYEKNILKNKISVPILNKKMMSAATHALVMLISARIATAVVMTKRYHALKGFI